MTPLAALLLLAACSRPTDEAVQFHDALSAQNGVKAFGLLSSQTRAALAKIARDAHAAAGESIPDDPALMIVQGDLSLYPPPEPPSHHVAQAELLSIDGSRAKVRVRMGDATNELDLVNEGRRWKIDLPVRAP